jgi:hypothetical protein
MNTHQPVEDQEEHEEREPAEDVSTHQEDAVSKPRHIGVKRIF